MKQFKWESDQSLEEHLKLSNLIVSLELTPGEISRVMNLNVGQALQIRDGKIVRTA